MFLVMPTKERFFKEFDSNSVNYYTRKKDCKNTTDTISNQLPKWKGEMTSTINNIFPWSLMNCIGINMYK